MNPKYPGIATVIHGNGAVAHVMGHVCGGVIGYPITPSTEISELYEAFRAGGGCNVWGRHPFFFCPEGEHSAQTGALGASLTGGKYVSNASSSQGILYGLELHYVTVGKKVGGFVLQVAARVVSRHSLNVMAGHDDVYALLSSGYTVLFGANPQEAADLAAISYKVSALSLIPVANAMDGFATSHMLCEALLPEPELLREYLGDPEGRIKAPTVAQEILFGAKGRVFQLGQYLTRHQADIAPGPLAALRTYLSGVAEQIERDNDGELVDATIGWIPEELRGQWRRQWLNAPEKGTRQRVPALVDVNNPGMTGVVQNQPDFQAGAVDHRTHFASEVPRFVRQAMREYSELTGRTYSPVQTFLCEDAEYVLVGLGSVTDDAETVASYLRGQGKKVGVVAIKLLQPFPEAELVEALRGVKAVTVLERSDVTALASFVTQALFKARENADGIRHPGIPAIATQPRVTTAIFGLGGHDLQPRHLIAAVRNMENPNGAPFVYLGSQFFARDASPRVAAMQDRLRVAYPETEFMALETEPNPHLLPDGAFRVRFHSVGGYGTIATGKLLTDILAGALGLHSKSAPKYGSEKSGAPTNYYITLSPEPVKLTNAELEEIEVVVSPDHKVFSHTSPLRGLAEGGSFILQSSLTPLEAWRELPAHARRTIRERRINFHVVDAFAVAKKHAPTPELETRMMGIAFIGAVAGHVDRASAGASQEAVLAKIRQQISKKFGGKGGSIVESNMEVVREGLEATQRVAYDLPEFLRVEEVAAVAPSRRTVALSASMCRAAAPAGTGGFLDREDYDDIVASRFRDGTIGEAPVLPGAGLFMPPGSAAWKDKGMFRLNAPEFLADRCTGCMECAIVCPDAAIPNTVHDIHDLLLTAIRHLDVTDAQKEALRGQVFAVATSVREAYRQGREATSFAQTVAEAIVGLPLEEVTLRRNLGRAVEVLETFPVARTRPFFDAMEKATAGHRRPVLRRRRSVEVQWLHGVRRCVRPRRPGAARPRTATCWKCCRAASSSSAARRTRRRASPNPRRGRMAKPSGCCLTAPITTPPPAATAPAAAAARSPPSVWSSPPTTPSRKGAGASMCANWRPLVGKLEAKSRHLTRRPARPCSGRANRAHPAHAGEAAVLVRERPDRQRPGRHGDRQLHRLQQRVRFHLPVQPVQRPVGEQPVPGCPAAGQGHFRGAGVPRRWTMCGRCAPARLELDEAYDPAVARLLFPPFLPLGGVHAGGNGAAADGDDHRRRRRHLRYRLRRPVAAAGHRHADQGGGAELRRLFQHRRPGLHGQLHGAQDSDLSRFGAAA